MIEVRLHRCITRKRSSCGIRLAMLSLMGVTLSTALNPQVRSNAGSRLTPVRKATPRFRRRVLCRRTSIKTSILPTSVAQAMPR